MIKRYGSKMSSVFRCHILAKELGLDFEEVPVNMGQGEHKSAEFLKLNPNGKIPCLVDGDFVIWESMAINSYLTAKFQPELLGTTIEKRALLDQWSYWAILYPQPHLFSLVMNQDADAQATAKEALLPYHRILDGALRDNDYLLGDQFTLADINVGSVMMINNLVGSDMAEYPALSAWLNRLMARPCFQ